jgi:ubiquinone/menaquinone biosynthesis C-methylase UbiE
MGICNLIDSIGIKMEHTVKVVQDYWDRHVCGTDITTCQKYTKEYFERIEDYRYSTEPEIHSFAQFTRYHGKLILEVGVGAGTDFLQWVRAGALANGIDLTREAVDHTKKRLSIYNFNNLNCWDVQQGNVEDLLYSDNLFDLVYSWGVIHHTPNMERALSELVRVLRYNGELKLMIYNRHSLSVYYRWIKYALLRGKPWKSLKWVLCNHVESYGTQAYTVKEIRKMFAKLPMYIWSIDATPNSYDLLRNHHWIFQKLANVAACILGWDTCGFFMRIRATKTS